MALREIKARLQKLASKETAAVLQWFFKTGPGENGEGDVFIGIKIPPLRKLAAEFEDEPPLFRTGRPEALARGNP